MAASTRTSPTVLRWELGARLRSLRTRSGLSIEDAARELMCSQAKVSRMETAGRGIQPRDVRDLCRLYTVEDTVRDELIRMANDAKRPGWWQQYGTLDEQAATYIGLESAATAINMLESRVIPGLLQIPEYSRLLLAGIATPPLEAEEIDDAVETRQRRRERIVSGEVEISVLLDETVLDRAFGDADILSRQLKELAELATLPNVSIRLIPLDAGPHPGVHGSFAHLIFRGRELADVIYLEGLWGNTFVERPSEVERFRQAYKASENQSWQPERSLQNLLDRCPD